MGWLTLHEPDLVDTCARLHPPDVDGLSVLRHAAEQVPPLPGILMTAADTATDTIDQALDAGLVQCLPKPFSHAALLEAIDRALK
jgi:CheY-like chemotaxis protein